MIVMVLLANMEDVAGEDWARDFVAPMRDIRAAYGQDYCQLDTHSSTYVRCIYVCTRYMSYLLLRK